MSNKTKCQALLLGTGVMGVKLYFVVVIQLLSYAKGDIRIKNTNKKFYKK